MLKIGLTGGMASGKSTVCEMLRSKGCIIIDADKVAHELILKGKPCYSPIVNAFGAQILDSAGEIDRQKLGSLAFGNPPLLETLNKIVHPEVIRQILTKLDMIQTAYPQSRVIVDASLMIESGFYKSFQCLVVVTCTLEQQIERLSARNGLTKAQAKQRISLQMPLEQKVRFADYVIDNSGLLENTKVQVDALFEAWNLNLWNV